MRQRCFASANAYLTSRDWWFASTAIPLLAATIGPLANIMSIAALVTSWRNKYDPAYPGDDEASIPYDDPRW
jgi:potassium channel subfamily K